LVAAATVSCAFGGHALQLPTTWDDRYLQQVDAPVRPVVAVLPFDAAGAAAAGSLSIGDMLATSLFKMGRFELVERQKISNVLSEQKLKLSGAIDDAIRVAEVGKLLGAEAVVYGAVSSATQQRFDKFAYDVIRTEVRLDLKAANTTTGKLVISESATGRSEVKIVTDARGGVIAGAVDTAAEFARAAAAAVARVAVKVSRLFPVVGRVVDVQGKQVVSTCGAASGANVGDVLIIFRALTALRNPATGRTVGWRKQIVAAATVRSSEQTVSTARVFRGAGAEVGGVKVGDLVVLKPATD